MRALWLLLLLPCTTAQAFVREYTEGNSQHQTVQAKQEYENFKTKISDQDKYYGGFRDLYRKFNEKVVVPGFISASPLPELARIVGPDVLGTSFRVGDTLYLRWAGSQTPQVGAVYAVFTPAIVSQNMGNPTDFSVGTPPTPGDSLPKEHRLAGYFFEGTGRVRITKIGQGLVEAVLDAQSGQVQIGDQLMPALPIHEALKQSYGTVQLAAAIVCGSPPDRISTSRNSFIYVNRGAKDGIKVGQLFEAVERVQLDSSAGVASPETSAGEAVVVYTTDSYSTAMITKQFDVIRMGSLLRTINPLNRTLSRAPFAGMSKEVPGAKAANLPAKGNSLDEIPEVPSIDDEQNNPPNLPDPMKYHGDPSLPVGGSTKAPKKSPLSELDALEKEQNFKSLSEAEKLRLSKLSRQERLGEKGEKADSGEVEDSSPGMPGLENSFAKGKKPAKKAGKKKKQSNDEEELNMLMMQN